jgi:hypothetical protein
MSALGIYLCIVVPGLVVIAVVSMIGNSSSPRNIDEGNVYLPPPPY